MEAASRFAEQGLFTVEGAVPGEALRWAGEVVEQFIADQLQRETAADGVGVLRPAQTPFVNVITRPLRHLGAVPLYLMGLPAVTAAAEAACGPDAICTTEWMVIKNRGDGERVAWHQDFVHDGRHTAINVGVQLDEVGQDAVRFIPGPRDGYRDICAAAAQYADDSPELLSAPVGAGGLTVHDVLLIHGSPPLTTQQCRRTLYLEFRQPEMLRDHPTLTGEYIELRRQLMDCARRLVERLGERPAGDPLQLLGDEEQRIIARLQAARGANDPANYCVPERGGDAPW